MDFAVLETIIFKISLISTRSSPPTAAAQRIRQRRRLAAVPEIRIFKRSAVPRVSGRCGVPHFHAQNGSSSFRSPAFSSSKWLKLVPEHHIFTFDRDLVPEPLPIFPFAAAHTYQNLGWSSNLLGFLPFPCNFIVSPHIHLYCGLSVEISRAGNVWVTV